MLDLLHYSTSTNLIIFAFVAVYGVIWRVSSRARTRRYPPGPPDELFIGNLRDLITKPPHLYYGELKETYGTSPAFAIYFVPTFNI